MAVLIRCISIETWPNLKEQQIAMALSWYAYGMKIAIDDAGRLVIPKELRNAAGLVPGVELEVEYRDGRIEIEPSPSAVKLRRRGSLTIMGSSGKRRLLSHQQVDRTIRSIRERRG
jgi:AbrB family looped-hinge helix DNA binding protein